MLNRTDKTTFLKKRDESDDSFEFQNGLFDYSELAHFSFGRSQEIITINEDIQDQQGFLVNLIEALNLDTNSIFEPQTNSLVGYISNVNSQTFEEVRVNIDENGIVYAVDNNILDLIWHTGSITLSLQDINFTTENQNFTYNNLKILVNGYNDSPFLNDGVDLAVDMEVEYGEDNIFLNSTQHFSDLDNSNSDLRLLSISNLKITSANIAPIYIENNTDASEIVFYDKNTDSLVINYSQLPDNDNNDYKITFSYTVTDEEVVNNVSNTQYGSIIIRRDGYFNQPQFDQNYNFNLNEDSQDGMGYFVDLSQALDSIHQVIFEEKVNIELTSVINPDNGQAISIWGSLLSDGKVIISNSDILDIMQDSSTLYLNLGNITIFDGINEPVIIENYTLPVIGINDKPTIVQNFYEEINFGEESQTNLLSGIEDIDNIESSLVLASEIEILINDEESSDILSISNSGEISINYNMLDPLFSYETYEISINYKISDGIDYSNSNNATIVINSLNNTPIAEDDYISINENEELSYNLLSNDYDPDGQDISFVEIIKFSNFGVKVNGQLIEPSEVDNYIISDDYGNITLGEYWDNINLDPGEIANINFNYIIEDSIGESAFFAQANVDIIGIQEQLINLEEAYFGNLFDDANMDYDDGNEDPAIFTANADEIFSSQGYLDLGLFSIDSSAVGTPFEGYLYTYDNNINIQNLDYGVDFELIFEGYNDDNDLLLTFRLNASGYYAIEEQLSNGISNFFAGARFVNNYEIEDLMQFEIVDNNMNNNGNNNGNLSTPNNMNINNQTDSDIFIFTGDINVKDNIIIETHKTITFEISDNLISKNNVVNLNQDFDYYNDLDLI